MIKRKTKADLCDEAHNLTVIDCAPNNIVVFCTSHTLCGDDNQDHGPLDKQEMTHYTALAQDIFNDHYDRLEANQYDEYGDEE